MAKVKPIGIDMKGLEEASKSSAPSFDTTRLQDRTAEVANLSAVRAKEMGEMREKPASKGPSFGQAFSEARKSGMTSFKWNGGTYGTKTKGETSSAKPAKPQSSASSPAPRASAPASSTKSSSTPPVGVGVRSMSPPPLIAARPAPTPVMLQGVKPKAAAPKAAAPKAAAPKPAAKSAAPQFPGIMQQQPPALLRYSNAPKSRTGTGFGSFKK